MCPRYYTHTERRKEALIQRWLRIRCPFNLPVIMGNSNNYTENENSSKAYEKERQAPALWMIIDHVEQFPTGCEPRSILDVEEVHKLLVRSRTVNVDDGRAVRRQRHFQCFHHNGPPSVLMIRHSTDHHELRCRMQIRTATRKSQVSP